MQLDDLIDWGAPAPSPLDPNNPFVGLGNRLLPEGVHIGDMCAVSWQDGFGNELRHSGEFVGVTPNCIKVQGVSYLVLGKDQITRFEVTLSMFDNPFIT